MAYYLSDELAENVVEAYRKYQQYLRQNEEEFPRGAFALGTADWYHNPRDHRCPHDGWLENLVISEVTHTNRRRTTILTRLLAAYHDGYIELYYPEVHSYKFEGPSCSGGLGDWLSDEFRLAPSGRVIHEIEWAGFPNSEGRGGLSRRPM